MVENMSLSHLSAFALSSSINAAGIVPHSKGGEDMLVYY